nr:YSIRK-type signal peptide-containing protein [Streptococcus salivarius]
MKNSFYHVAQRFSIRKYSFGAASVLLGVFPTFWCTDCSC